MSARVFINFFRELCQRTGPDGGYIYILYSQRTGMRTFCSRKKPEKVHSRMRRRYGTRYSMTWSHFEQVDVRYAQFKGMCAEGLLPCDALYQIDKIDVFDAYKYTM